MRDLTTEKKIRQFMKLFGRAARERCRVYFTGGSTAVLSGWREATLDIDIRFYPELDELYRAIPDIKEKLQINIELAAPSDFIPPIPGWQDRSQYIQTEGKIDFFNYDPYSQARAKIERGHEQDRRDVESMLESGSIEGEKLREFFKDIGPFLYKYPAIAPADFAARVEEIVNLRKKT
jgi:hypothetical protein